MRKWMVEFLRKFDNRNIKIVRVNLIRITKFTNLLKFCSVLRVSCDVEILNLPPVRSPLIEKSMDFVI